MCSPVHGLRTQRRKKKKRFISGTTCYCKCNYSVYVSVFELVEKELDFEKNGPRKRANFLLIFLDVNSVKLVKPSDLTKNRVYLRVNTILVPKNVNSVNSEC